LSGSSRTPIEIQDWDDLTQFVTRELQRDRPKRGQADQSMLFGRLTIAEAVALVARRGVLPGDGVRFTIARCLREAGFVVTSTPSKAIPQHVSVTRAEEWDDEAAKRFTECLTEPEWEEESHG
jgi:hypothetical protein